ncbi:phosphatase PAP2 family protein [Patescibacteria group bacterium]|nr:phosphatase PAP2 family protein [Patescibacteria group bacterium]MCL5798328.1 phosphatase PAP2 family protein [Patescibacteria group bacterium]
MIPLIIFSAQYLYLVVITLGTITVFTSTKRIQRNYVKLILGTFPLAYLISKILAVMIIDPRPYIVQHIQPLIHASTDNGFPSDHTLLTMAIASVIFIYHKKIGILLGVLSVCIGIARVLSNVHHPIDIIGSIVISITSTFIIWYFLNKFKLLK